MCFAIFFYYASHSCCLSSIYFVNLKIIYVKIVGHYTCRAGIKEELLGFCCLLKYAVCYDIVSCAITACNHFVIWAGL